MHNPEIWQESGKGRFPKPLQRAPEQGALSSHTHGREYFLIAIFNTGSPLPFDAGRNRRGAFCLVRWRCERRTRLLVLRRSRPSDYSVSASGGDAKQASGRNWTQRLFGQQLCRLLDRSSEYPTYFNRVIVKKFARLINFILRTSIGINI